MKRMWSKNELKQQADARVEALVEGGTLNNAKPIYCHPITLIGEGGAHHLTMLILNNIAEAFADFDALITHIRTWGLDTARIMSSGVFKESDNKIVIASYLMVTENTIRLVGNYADTGSTVSIDITANNFNTFYDAVNKIN